VAFHVTDVKAVTRFYCDVLGFRVSTGWAIISRFCAAGPIITPSTLVETGKNKHFHTAFELRDWAHMQTACDLLSRTASRCSGGPDATASGTICFAITQPEREITELFAELDQMKDEALGYFEPRPWHRDNPQRRRHGRRRRRPRICGTDAAGRDDGIGTCKLRPHPEEAAISAFTRVCDALWPPSRRMAAARVPALVLRDAILRIAPQDEVFETRGYAALLSMRSSRRDPSDRSSG